MHSSYVKNVELAERIERKMMKDLILYNHRSVLCSIGMSTEDVELDQPSLYCIPKLHKYRWWVCQMLHETSFQFINTNCISGQNRASELLWN